MSQSFYFVGDPGGDRQHKLEILREAGLEPRRVEPGIDELAEIEAARPVAIVLGPEVADRHQLVAALRERPGLAGAPLIAAVLDAQPDTVGEVFAAGVDDYLVDGASTQLRTLAATLQHADIYHVVRAPKGLVLLADQNRDERVRLGHVLRRNGFDIHFAADTTELERSIGEQAPRAVIASADLTGGDIVTALADTGFADGALPLVLVASQSRLAQLNERIPSGANAMLFEADGDPERLTFIMNELLTPAPPNVRQSARLLHAAPTWFRQGSDGPRFFGYSFNVNLGGMFVRTLTPLPMQTQLEIGFRPPFGRGEVVAQAQVVWRKEFASGAGPSSPAGMGLQFIDWPAADRAGYAAGYNALREHQQPGVCSRPPSSPLD